MSAHYATVDSRRELLIVASYSKTTAGFWVMNGEFEILDGGADDVRLGRSVREALAHSAEDMPVPDWSSLPIEPVLSHLGIETLGAYLKGTKQLGVTSDRQLTLMPTRNQGARDGFVELEGSAVKLEASVPDSELGTAVRSGLALAE